jgi:hypothetical protein
VSPAYTALEYLRELNDGPAADLGSANAAQLGADTPQHAVEDALHAWQAADWNRLLALAPPDELPVYDYRAFIDQQAADTHPDFTIDSLSTTADVSGDSGVVHLTASGTSGSGADQQTWQVGGSCPSIGSWIDNSSFSGDTVSPASATPNQSLCLAGDLGQAVPLGLFLLAAPPDSAATGPVSIKVVREDGRWFVSPVGTALDIVDSFVQHVDERTLYPLIGLGYQLPPDGTLTVNQPMHLADATGFGEVYAFDGNAGEQLVGEVEHGSRSYYYLSPEVYSVDGRRLGYVDFESKDTGCCAESVTLPTTGSYRLVMTEPIAADTTITLWDTDKAPKSLLNPPSESSSGQSCTYSANSVSCFGTAKPIIRVGQSSGEFSGVSKSVAEATTTSVP